METTILLVPLWGLPVSGFEPSSATTCNQVAASVRADMAAALRVRPSTPAAKQAVRQIQDWSVECRPLSDLPPEMLQARF